MYVPTMCACTSVHASVKQCPELVTQQIVPVWVDVCAALVVVYTRTLLQSLLSSYSQLLYTLISIPRIASQPLGRKCRLLGMGDHSPLHLAIHVNMHAHVLELSTSLSHSPPPSLSLSPLSPSPS